MFPQRLPSNMKENVESLEVLSEFESWESRKIHLQVCCPGIASPAVTKIVVLFLNDVISSIVFQSCAVRASVLYQSQKVECTHRHNLIGNE